MMLRGATALSLVFAGAGEGPISELIEETWRQGAGWRNAAVALAFQKEDQNRRSEGGGSFAGDWALDFGTRIC